MTVSEKQESMTTDTVKLALELSKDEAYTMQSEARSCVTRYTPPALRRADRC